MKTIERKTMILAIGLLTLAFGQCTSLEFHNPQKGVELNLAAREAECKEPIEFRHWTFLYGTIPIRFLNTNPEDMIVGKNIRIKEKSTWLDFVISILGGFSTSITTRTIMIENCDVVNIEKPREEVKKEEIPQAETKPSASPQVEAKPDKPQLMESNASEKKTSEIIIDENSLLDEEPTPETKLAKTKTTKPNKKKK
jgi:hypothetical protein